uniref:Cat1 n=1 Tax=Arundo donax TaxID=35708 RepID=A0A0A9F9M3_ARUDO
MSDLKETLGTGSPCMNNTFRDTFPVKLSKLLNQMVVLKEDRPSLSDGEGRVVVPDGGARVGGPDAGVAATRRPVLVWIHGRLGLGRTPLLWVRFLGGRREAMLVGAAIRMRGVGRRKATVFLSKT